MRLIAGMHRSGTSLVARLFFEAGADMGDPATFYRPDKWNPDGYFEQTDIHSINIPLINGPFWKLAYFFLPSERTIRRRARSRSSTIRSVSEKYRHKVVKENRFCLTLSAWIEQGAEIERVLFVLREPAAVAQSLRRRNRITISKAYSLWLTHNRRLLDAVDRYGLHLHFIRYTAVLDPEFRLGELLAGLDFMGVKTSPERAQGLLTRIVKVPESPMVSNPIVEYPDPVAELWDLLCARHAKQTTSSVPLFPADQALPTP